MERALKEAILVIPQPRRRVCIANLTTSFESAPLSTPFESPAFPRGDLEDKSDAPFFDSAPSPHSQSFTGRVHSMPTAPISMPAPRPNAPALPAYLTMQHFDRGMNRMNNSIYSFSPLAYSI
mmetsp:Transcript_29969/g.66308  ORF Transcript_29969/g.66308 Transcript_29969/m.66308 type:complete len:122 (+) Transcript_29969:165-530(+)